MLLLLLAQLLLLLLLLAQLLLLLLLLAQLLLQLLLPLIMSEELPVLRRNIRAMLGTARMGEIHVVLISRSWEESHIGHSMIFSLLQTFPLPSPCIYCDRADSLEFAMTIMQIAQFLKYWNEKVDENSDDHRRMNEWLSDVVASTYVVLVRQQDGPIELS
jgi:hypothetical protein